MIYAIVGPTASGKTSLAIKLAKYFNAPIINADAFQVYRDMNIGTGKVAEDSEEYNIHYLLDIKTPDQQYSVKEYQTDFRSVLEKLQKTYQNLIICGGTGLYLKAGLFDFEFPDEEQPDTSDLEQLSNEELYKMLKELDAKSADIIHMNNRKRVIRAIAVARTHGVTKSEIIEKQDHKMLYNDVKIYMLNPERDILYKNINARVDGMFKDGLIGEVEGLLENYELSLTSKAAIGYKEVIDYLENKCSLEECKEMVKQRSRNYAKRQLTYFKHQLPVIMKETAEEIYEEIING